METPHKGDFKQIKLKKKKKKDPLEAKRTMFTLDTFSFWKTLLSSLIFHVIRVGLRSTEFCDI